MSSESRPENNVTIPSNGGEVNRKMAIETHRSRYSVKIDGMDRERWAGIMKLFGDANLYQTWSYGALRWGEKALSHLILFKDGKVAAAAQARIVRIPLIGRGIAYIRWGPMWKPASGEKDHGSIREMVQAMRNEYVTRRNLFLRVLPDEYEDEEVIRRIFEEEGYRWSRGTYRTILLDLSQSMDELRKNLKKSWRNRLNHAERRGMTIVEGSDEHLFMKLYETYNEMLARKKFVPGLDIDEFRLIHGDLPDDLKMRITICMYENHPVYSCLTSVIGDRGIFILGGTGEKGMELKASYLAVWKTLEWMKKSGAKWCDLGGYNPEGNPGTSHFKKGLAGRDTRQLGQFEAYRGYPGLFFVRVGEKLRDLYQLLRLHVSPLKKKKSVIKTILGG